MLVIKTVLTGKYLYSFPQTDWVAAKGKNIADPYQPTSERLWKVFVMEGMAVVIMVCCDIKVEP